MPLHEIIILALLQSLTEFLPVSSSAHLLLYTEILAEERLPLLLNLALHGGSTLSLLFYFRRDWTTFLRQEMQAPSTSKLPHIFIATLPIAIIGLCCQNMVETTLHKPAVVVAPLAIVGILLWCADRYSQANLSINNLRYQHALIIGLMQVLALIPGVSRSGICMLTARTLKINRHDSVKLSFLLGTPVMLGAVLLNVSALYTLLQQPKFFLGVVVSAVSSFLVIKFLLRYITRIGFASFAIYRLLVAFSLFIYLLI